MKMTVLEIIQEVLSYIDGDEVTDWDDTTESEQVYTIVKSTYYNMMSNRLWPHLRKGVTVATLADVNTPTHMALADTIKELCFINYDVATTTDTRKKYTELKYLSSEEFIHRTNQEDDSLSEVQVVTDLSGIELMIRNDRAPTYYTSFDDENLVMDSFDSAVSTTLETAKVQAQAYVLPTWTDGTDSFIPDLPDDAFRSLVESCKSVASQSLIQTADPKAEQEATRQSRWLSRKARRVEGGIKFASFGRRK